VRSLSANDRFVAAAASDVPDVEFSRLLGYPPQHALSDGVRALMSAARERARRTARPVVRVDVAEVVQCTHDRVSWTSASADGVFTSSALARRLAGARTFHAAIVSLGAEFDELVAAVEARDDLVETYFLDRFGAAWCEALLRGVASELEQRMGHALAPLGPGHEDWDVAQQPEFLRLFEAVDARLPRCNADALLEPRYSLTAVFGRRERPLDGQTTCGTCTLAGCNFRRPARGLAWTSE